MAEFEKCADPDCDHRKRNQRHAHAVGWVRPKPQTDTGLIDFLEGECLDLRCVSLSNGDAGDADIGWEVIQHHMEKPRERVIGRGSSPREAIKEAINQEAKRPAGAPRASRALS